MKNFKWCKYTYEHRKAFEYCVRKYIHEPELNARMLERALLHDMDKMVMYLFLDCTTAQQIHVETQPHHLENELPRTFEDYVETVIDLECAPYTKPDKPLNAYDFTKSLMKRNIIDTETGRKLIDIMEDLGIARSGTVTQDEEGLAYIRNLEEVTEEMIYEDVSGYLQRMVFEKEERI